MSGGLNRRQNFTDIFVFRHFLEVALDSSDNDVSHRTEVSWYQATLAGRNFAKSFLQREIKKKIIDIYMIIQSLMI